MEWIIFEIVYTILNNLTIKDIVICSTVNKLFYLVCDNQYGRLLIEDYEIIPGFLDTKIPEYLNCDSKEKYIMWDELMNLVDWSSCKCCLSNLEKMIASSEILIVNKTIKRIPNSIKYLTNMSALEISINLIEKIPDSICTLKKLKTLILCHNRIVRIPDVISELTNLERLNLRWNLIIEFPESLCELKKLKSLDLANNKIKQIPDSISKLDRLCSLDLSANEIKKMPSTVTLLTNLVSLDMRSNR